MKQLLKISAIVLPCFLLAACGGSDEPAVKEAATVDQKAITLQEGAPALGTDIAQVVKVDEKQGDEDYEDVLWEALIPEGFQPEEILSRYQQQIQEAEEGSVEERELYKVVMAEFNNAGANESLNGKKIRIPGFVAPLETNGDMVGEFLLVPYYGSCIHSPPPPAHHTVMVTPEVDKSVALDDIYLPVWVVGEIVVEQIDTELATAGYQIKNAKVELYNEPMPN